jgi:hypothetical protein
MTTRKHLENLVADLAKRGVLVEEDEEKKTVRFKMPARDLMTLPDKKLYSLLQASAKVERIFRSMGYKTADESYERTFDDESDN